MPLRMFESTTSHPLGHIPNVIAVSSCKGGVGKSSLTVLLAEIFREQGKRVGILDADVYGPSIRHTLPEDRPPKEVNGTITPALARGIELISMAHFREEGQAAAMRAPMANGIIKQFIQKVAWGPLDVLLIDFPPGTGDIQLSLAQQVPLTGALIITTPQKLALLDVRKGIELFNRLKVPIIGLIENMSYLLMEGKKTYPFGKGGGARLTQDLGLPLLGEIPFIEEFRECIDAGKDFLNSHPDSPYLPQLIELGQRVRAHTKSLYSQDPNVLRSFDIQWRVMETC